MGSKTTRLRYSVKYKQGKANANSDTMSRIPTEDSGIYEITIEKIKDMLEAQREDRETLKKRID